MAAARSFRGNESSVRHIKKNENKIRESSEVTASERAKRAVRSFKKRIRLRRIEASLALWITDGRKQKFRSTRE